MWSHPAWQFVLFMAGALITGLGLYLPNQDLGAWLILIGFFGMAGGVWVVAWSTWGRKSARSGDEYVEDKGGKSAFASDDEEASEQVAADDDSNEQAIMAQWEPTHAYDLPIKLQILDTTIEVLDSEFLVFLSDTDHVSRMWTAYITSGDANLLETHLGILEGEEERLWWKIEATRARNHRYDDIRGILEQEYHWRFPYALQAFKAAVLEHKGDADEDHLIAVLAPAADGFREAWRDVTSWHGNVRLTLLRRRRWLLRQSAATDPPAAVRPSLTRPR